MNKSFFELNNIMGTPSLQLPEELREPIREHLNNLQKSKLIAFGCITTTIINPNLAVYEFFLFIPSILFLIDNFKFKLSFLESEKIKYLIILSFVVVQDINFPLFCSAIVFFYILYYNFKYPKKVIYNLFSKSTIKSNLKFLYLYIIIFKYKIIWSFEIQDICPYTQSNICWIWHIITWIKI